MKILLISPGRGPNIKQQKSVMMPQLALDLLAGLTPLEHAVTIVEEEYNAIDLDADCDLAGLSCMTSNAPRGYELAGEFKKRGKAVVMGGVHPTILPDEALGHADAVVIGFDEDTSRTFPETLEFMKRNGVGSASINVLTPYPGTEIHRQLKAEGRIFTDDWRYYNHNTVVFRPKNLSLPELLAGRIWARNEFTRTSAALRRLAANRAHPLLHLAINRASWRSSRKQIRNFPKAAAELCRMESRARGEEESRGPEQFRFEDFIPGALKT